MILRHRDLVVARKDKTKTLRHESTYVIPCIFIDEYWCAVSCLPHMSIFSSHVYAISNEEVKKFSRYFQYHVISIDYLCNALNLIKIFVMQVSTTL